MNIAISALAIAGRAIYYVSCYVVAARVLGYAFDWHDKYRRKERLAAFAAKQAAFEDHTLPEDLILEANADDNAKDSWGKQYKINNPDDCECTMYDADEHCLDCGASP